MYVIARPVQLRFERVRSVGALRTRRLRRRPTVSSSATTSPATATTRRETKSTPTARALVSSPARLVFTLAFASVHSNRRPVAANFSSLESPPRTQSPPRGDDDVPRRRREVDARAPTLDRAIATATTMGTTTRAFVQPRARRRRRREKTLEEYFRGVHRKMCVPRRIFARVRIFGPRGARIETRDRVRRDVDDARVCRHLGRRRVSFRINHQTVRKDGFRRLVGTGVFLLRHIRTGCGSAVFRAHEERGVPS